MNGFQKILIVILMITGGVVLAYFSLIWQDLPDEPLLSAKIKRSTIKVGDLVRSYDFYIPKRVNKKALLIVLHGSMDTGALIRAQTAYEFDQLADEHEFIVVYPDGYEHHWNDCRKSSNYSANTLGIDDVGFIQQLIARFKNDILDDDTQVFITGFSNGGQMSFRLALELATEVDAIASVAANMPIADNFACTDLGITLPVMVMNGTDDPINPFNGGSVGLFGIGNQGNVLSTEKTFDFWSKRAGHQAGSMVYQYPNINNSDNSTVERRIKTTISLPEVSLYKVLGGGHTIPQSSFSFPKLLGNTNGDISAPEEIWQFFERQR